MKRIQKEIIKRDLKKKIVFIVGPRQVGKTWLAKKIATDYHEPLYLNFDSLKDREIIHGENWLPTIDLLILDEIHKMKNWKNYLKGIFDNRPQNLHILVTGSARLDAFRQSGDSLAGRYYIHHLFPLSYKEAMIDKKFTLDYLIARGGFPEPLLAENSEEADRWRRLYTDSLIREDILDFENIHELGKMRLLLELLRKRVASPISYSSLAHDLETAPNTVKKYIQILEMLYIIFRITPFSRNIARSLKKEPKIYFFDTGMVDGDAGVKFENYLALSLLKHCHHRTDNSGSKMRLNYLRTKEKREVDFCLTENEKPTLLIEAKNVEISLNKDIYYFNKKYRIPAEQIVRYLNKERIKDSIKIRKAESFFRELAI